MLVVRRSRIEGLLVDLEQVVHILVLHTQRLVVAIDNLRRRFLVVVPILLELDLILQMPSNLDFLLLTAIIIAPTVVHHLRSHYPSVAFHHP